MISCIIICRKNKSNRRKGKVLFIDAKAEVTRKNGESYLEEHHIERILKTYNDYSSEEGFSVVIDNQDIIVNKSLLGIQYYVRSSFAKGDYNLEIEYENWKSSLSNTHAMYTNLINKVNNGEI